MKINKIYSSSHFFIFFSFFKYSFSLSFNILCTVYFAFASNSNSSVLILKLFRSHLHTSLKHKFGQPRLCMLTTNLPYNRLWDLLNTHPKYMSEPAKPALTEGKVHGGKNSKS